MPTQHAVHARTDPFDALQVPATEDAYNGLSQSRQAAFVQALTGLFSTTRSSTPPCGPTVRTACSDFLADVNDGVVLTVRVIYDPFRTAIIVSGDFDRKSAARYAAAMAR